MAVVLACLRSDLEREMAAHSSILARRIPWTDHVWGSTKSGPKVRLKLIAMKTRSR